MHTIIWKTMPGIFWNPVVLVVLFILFLIILKILGKMFFRVDYNRETGQVKPFNSGNIEEINYNVKSSNLYWGFKNALDLYYRNIEALHNGDFNDYLKWFAFALALCLMLIAGGLL